MKAAIRSLLRDPAWLAAFISLIMSVWLVATDDMINNDGVLYIEASAQFLQGNWHAGLEVYNWPFYSLLIAAISKVSFLGLETSAYAVNVLLQALLAFVFVRSAQALGGNRRVAIAASILLLTNVTLNGYRDLVIRDFGYWAFFFTAFLFFLNFHRTRLLKYAIGFSLSIMIATLFRIEGIAFLVAAPLIMLFDKEGWKTRLYNILKLSSPLILVAVLCVPFLLLSDSIPEFRGRLNDPLNLLQHAYFNIVTGISEKGRMIENLILSTNAKNMGTKSMLAILLMFLIMKTISAIGYIPLIFSVSGSLSRRIRSTMTGLNIVGGFIVINLLVLTAFTLSEHFLTPRYTMCMALLMTFPAAFMLADYFEKPQPVSGDKPRVWKRRSKIIIVIALIYMLLDGLTSFSAGNAHIREAGLWMKENVPQQARLIASERTLYYYAGKPVDQEAVELASSATEDEKISEIDKKDYDYLAIDINRKKKVFEQVIIDWVGNKPVHRTENRRGDAVVIFALKQ